MKKSKRGGVRPGAGNKLKEIKTVKTWYYCLPTHINDFKHIILIKRYELGYNITKKVAGEVIELNKLGFKFSEQILTKCKLIKKGVKL